MFDYVNEAHLNAYKSLQGMINKNNGVWYSGKQRDFLLSNKSPLPFYHLKDVDPVFVKNNFGIDFDTETTQKLVMVEARSHFGGARGHRPVTWMFVLDQFGVVTKYRLRYSGNMRGGTAPNPNKTSVEFSRYEIEPGVLVDATKPLTKYDEEKAASEADKPEFKPETSEFIGVPGERFVKTFTLQRSFERDGNFGSYILNIMRDEEDNLYFMNSSRAFFDAAGDTAKLRVTVKNHFMTKQGVKATSVGRPFVVKEK